jgi:plasmid stabilization system protein ParE
MKPRVLPTAMADLESIDIYLMKEFGASAASATQAGLLRTFELLAAFPALGHPRPDVTPKPVRFFLQKPYWIVYEAGEPLLIHRVYHAARDLSRMDKSEFDP